MDAHPPLPVFTPVFDAHDHWAAIRINHAPNFQPGPGLVTSLQETIWPDTEEASSNPLSALPLLVETTDPKPWLQIFGAAERPCKLHLLVPAEQVAAAATQTGIGTPSCVSVTLMSLGVPDANAPVQALGINAAQGLEDRHPALLQRLPGPHLATNIASQSTHRQCVQYGFHWFEGSWPLQASGAAEAQNATSRSTLLNLLGLVATDADTHELETLFKRDPNLSYQLLKLINSVGFSLSHKITSFRQAITLLGRRQLQRWLQLLLYAGQHGDGGASALLSLVARRAALLEHAVAARGGKQEDKDCAFMTGMFSLLDVLFRAPIADLVMPLKLHEKVTRALVAHEGTLGRLLRLAIETENNAVKSGPENDAMETLAALEITPERFVGIQLQALAWAAQISGQMK